MDKENKTPIIAQIRIRRSHLVFATGIAFGSKFDSYIAGPFGKCCVGSRSFWLL